MSYKIEIADPTSHKIEISSSINDQTPSIQILEGHSSDINISHDIALLPADFNDNVKTIIANFLAVGYGISIVPSGSFLRISTSGLQSSGNYSLVGHSHFSSDITNFNSSVSGLLPVKNVVSGSGIAVSDINGTFTVAVTGQFGLTSEQVDDRVSSLLSSGYGINLNYDDNNNLLTISTIGLQPSGNYSVVGHSHVAADISDFVSAASGSAPVQTVAGRAGNILLTKNDVGLNNVDNTSDTNKPISSATQNALNLKSDIGHLHTSSNITDFSSSVSGLLPVKNILSGSGISVTSSGSDFTVAVTGQFGLTGEQVDDRISNLLVAGNYVNLNYNDSADILTVSVTGVQPSGNYSITGHSHVISDVSGLQNALDSKQPSGNYANFVHVHTSSDITDFNSSVSGLLPVKNIIGSGYVNISSSSGNFTVSVNGLQPSGNYADLVHTHTSSQITDFNSSVSGLLTPYATINSPNFSGIPTAPTATSGTNNSQIANTQFVRTEISNLVNSAPSTLDTLNELATALGNDPNFATTVTNSLASKAALSGAIFTGPVTIPSGTGNFNNLTINGINVSVSGHTHTSSNITDFNSGVSGLLPAIAGSGYVISNFSNNIYTISVTGLQPSGNYSVVGHNHTTNDIINFASGVSDSLTTALLSGSFINLTYDSILDTLTINATGLQPSGNYSVIGHSHASSDITDFNSSVSGLLPVKDVVASSGINISSVSGIYTISSPGNFSTLQVNGTGVVASSGGNSGYLSKFTASNTIDDSIIYQSSGNIGINTTNPSYQLDVSGSIRTLRSDANEFLSYERSGVGTGGLAISASATTFRSSLPYRFIVGANEHVRIDSSGNVGIGTTTPSGKLHIGSGDLHFDSGYGLRWAGGSRLYEERFGVAGGSTERMLYLANGDRFEVLTENGVNFIAGFHGANSLLTNSIRLYRAVGIGSNYAASGSLPVNGLAVQGNVGIGVQSPIAPLHVIGSGVYSTSDSSSIITIDPSGRSIDCNPSAFSDICLKANNQFIFRGLDGWTGTWADAAITTYFQVGRNAGNTIFTSLQGAPFTRLAYSANKIFFANGTSNLPIPSGYFTIGSSIDGGSVGTSGLVIDTVHRSSSANGQSHGALVVTPLFNTVSSNLNNIYGAYIEPRHSGVYTTTNSYGLYVNAATNISGTITNNYAAVFNGGNVGIGTPTPSSALQVVGSGIFSSGIAVGSNSTNGYIIGPSGNTYIHINNGGTNRLDINSNTYTNSNIYLSTQFTYLNSQSTYCNGTLQFPMAGNNATSTATQRDSNSIILYNKLWDGVAQTGPGNEIISKASTTTNLQSRFAFLMHNQDGTQNRTERFSILSNGNVGIGITNPSGQLHVVGTGIVSSRLGIGTNSPQYSLDVSGSGNFNNVLISGIPLSEVIDDEVAGLLVAGTGINLTYDDNNNQLILSSENYYGANRGIIEVSAPASSFNIPGGYTVGGFDLFLNGVKLVNDIDFTATNGNSINTASPIPSGSVLEYISLTLANPLRIASDQYSAEISREVISVTGTLSTINIIGGYDSGGLDVYKDGLKLIKDIQYSANNGSSISLTTPATSGSVIEYVSFLAGKARRSINTITNSTTAGTIPQTDYIYVATVPNITVTMPSAVGNNNRYTIKNLSNGTINVAPTPGQTIDNQSIISILNQYISIDLVSNNQNWIII